MTEKMEPKQDHKKDLLPNYLQKNDFVVELNFMLWVTKGARFKASERCNQQGEKYTQVIGYVTAYLIIISVVGLCEIPCSLPDNYNTLISIALSIIVLVASQFLYASNYAVKSIEYHCCALEISKLYNELRLMKSEDVSLDRVRDITERYEHVLERYYNHLPIDFDVFKTTKYKYFGLSKRQRKLIKFRYFIKCDLVYYLCIFGFPIGYGLLIWLFGGQNVVR